MVVVAIFLVTFAVQPSRIPSESMLPTLKVGDFLLVDKQTFAPAGRLDALLLPRVPLRRGDLVVFHYPVDGNVTLVKRVIGLPGDRLRLHLGKVLIDGVPLDEPYAMYTPSRANNYRDEFPSQREFPEEQVQTGWWLRLRRIVADGEITVPPGCYFVLGDNRNDSEDSRYWGFVRQDEIIGRPLLVYFTARAEHATGAMDRLRAEWNALHVPR
jgi:signal peptidase I